MNPPDTLTGTTLNPANMAEAGFVPWADIGIKQIVLFWSFLTEWYFRMHSNPVYSPCAPEFGYNETAAICVSSHNQVEILLISF